MLRKLKDLRVILVILLILSWVSVGVFFYMYKQNMDEKIASKDLEISDLNTSLSAIGELVPAYTVVSDVPSGKKIEETDLQVIDVPLSMSTNLVQDSSELVGKYFKLGMTAGSVITTDCVYEEVITSDMRYYDVLVDILPIGLKPGAFVDIRIKFGTGADFIGLSHCQVIEINGNVLKLVLTEEDINVYSSMLIDNIMFNETLQSTLDLNGDGKINTSDKVSAVGAYIYAVEYLEGGIQEKPENIYAPSTLVQGIMASNPNILEANLNANDMALKRKLIEAGLVDLNSISTTADNVKEVVEEAIKEGRKEYDKRVEAELEAAEG